MPIGALGMLGIGAAQSLLDYGLNSLSEKEQQPIEQLQPPIPYSISTPANSKEMGFKMEHGGSPNQNIINIEKGELGIDSKGNIVEDFTDNRFSKHSVHGKDPINNIVNTTSDFIIPKKYAKEYKDGDKITRKGIIRMVAKEAGSPTYVKAKGGLVPKYQEGGPTDIVIDGVTYSMSDLNYLNSPGGKGWQYKGKGLPIKIQRALDKNAIFDNSGNLTGFKNQEAASITSPWTEGESKTYRLDEIVSNIFGLNDTEQSSNQGVSKTTTKLPKQGESNVKGIDPIGINQNIVPSQSRPKMETYEQLPLTSIKDAYNKVYGDVQDFNPTPSETITQRGTSVPQPIQDNPSPQNITAPEESSTPSTPSGGGNFKGGQLLGRLATYAPTIFNAIAAASPVEQFSPIYNPNEGEALDVLRNRSIDDSAVQAQINRQRALADQNAKIGASSSGSLHQRLRQNYVSAANVAAQSKERTSAINQGFKGDYANALNNFGQQRAQADMYNRQANIGTRANRTQFLTSAISGLSTAYQNESRNAILKDLTDKAYPELTALRNRP